MSEQSKWNNKDLLSKERTVGSEFWGYTKYQLWRYLQALLYINNGESVVDLGSGCGYGSLILSQKAGMVTSVDDSQDAIAFADQNFSSPNIIRSNVDLLLIKESFDVTIAFEIVEHIKDEQLIFDLLRKITNRLLILTVPDVSIPVAKHHWKHYTVTEVQTLLTAHGFDILDLKLILHKPNVGHYGIFAVGLKR